MTRYRKFQVLMKFHFIMHTKSFRMHISKSQFNGVLPVITCYELPPPPPPQIINIDAKDERYEH